MCRRFSDFYKYPFLFFFVSYLIAACGNSQNSNSNNNATDMALLNRTWHLQTVQKTDGSSVDAQTLNQFLKFGPDSKFTGSDSCDDVGGVYQVQSGNISFSNMSWTQAFCPSLQSTGFGDGIQNAKTYTVSGSTLLIQSSGSTKQMSFIVQ